MFDSPFIQQVLHILVAFRISNIYIYKDFTLLFKNISIRKQTSGPFKYYFTYDYRLNDRYDGNGSKEDCNPDHVLTGC